MTKTKVRNIVSALLLGAAFSGAASPAFAIRAQETTLRGVREALRDIRSDLRDYKRDFGNYQDGFKEYDKGLVENLRAATGENSAYVDKQIEANRRIEDAVQINETARQKQLIRAEAESGKFDPNPVACFLLDLFGPGKDSGTTTLDGPGSYVVGSVMQANSSVSDAARPQAVATVAREEPKPYGEHQDADTNGRAFTENPTVDLSDDAALQAASSYVRNFIDAVPEAMVDEEEMRTPEGQVRATEIKEKRARQSAALDVLAMSLNMSSPIVSSDTIRELTKDTVYNREIPEGNASELQLLDAFVISYYAPSKEAQAKRQSPNAVMQSMLHLQSIQARMQYLSLELQRRDALVNAAILATMVENKGQRDVAAFQ